jgi:5-(carboxyamino)imidazole ribonucleotide synthase
VDDAGGIVGVLGAGQLGGMLGLAGLPLGLRFRYLDPAGAALAGTVGDLRVGSLDDAAAAVALADGAAVVTYEWEGVPAATARAAATRAPVRPDPVALEVAQDRMREKTRFGALGIAVPAFAAVTARTDLDAALAVVGLPAVLKTRRGGYDGKGQRFLRAATEVDSAWAALHGEPLILEELVTFSRELSIIAVRGLDGATACYPLVETEQRDGVLRACRAPAPGVSASLQAAAEDIAGSILDELGYVGVLAVELFERDGTLIANELAPRVHNSGHWTIEGAVTSQFENHLRAILGWPLGSTAARGSSGLVNALGSLPSRDAVLAVPGAHLHDYHKGPRPGRKVGHVTVVADTDDARDRQLGVIRAVLDAQPA